MIDTSKFEKELNQEFTELLDRADGLVRERMAALYARIEARIATLKGDFEGHPFRGNQWTEGGGGGGSEGESEGSASGGSETISRNISAARSYAQESGFNPDHIEQGGPGRKFTVGGESMEAGAEFHPTTGKISIYDGVLSDPDENFVKGVVAHEINHAKFMSVSEQYDSEKTSLAFNRHKLDRDGELLPQYRKEYPTYHALHSYFDGDKYDQLSREDGVTDYSRAYWKGRGLKGSKRMTAIDETLAEVSYLRAQNKAGNVSDTWSKLERTVHAHYSKANKIK